MEETLPTTENNPTQSAPSNYKWKVLASVIFGIFMVILDTTVINVAFQTLRQDFGGNLNDTQWIISIYVLAIGITTPLAGFLADRFGGKKIYLGGLGLFAIGSLLCGLSPNLGLLIVARAIQGIGGGIAMPLGTALLLRAFPVAEQGMALGIFGIAALVAPAIGPIVGGWLVDQNLWRVIFFINPPIGLIGVLLGTRFLREQKSDHKPAFDLAGVLTEIVGFGAILYAASVAANQGWTAPGTLFWFGIGVAGLILFGIVELFQAKAPLLDLRLFANRTFLNASLLGYVSTVALFGAEFLMPIYLQALRGLSALQTGFILLPMAITGGICVTLSGRLYDRVGPRPLMAAGFTILIINTWQLSLIQADTSIAWILFLLALRGLALGLTVQTTLVTALSVVTKRDLARGSSLANATRFVVQSIGVAVLATVLASTISPQVAALQNQASSAAGKSSGATMALCQPGGRSSNGLALLSGSGPKQPRLTDTAYPPSGQGQGPTPPANLASLLQQACRENIAGFERAYKVTFFAAFAALLLGLMLPGWP
ncbi:MAG TPA: MDR family MFS transporter, partial [Anaerolineales bacterium]